MKITVCDHNNIRGWNGLPDCYHTVYAVLTRDCITMPLFSMTPNKDIGYFDTEAAAKALNCNPYDLVILDREYEDSDDTCFSIWDVAVRDMDGFPVKSEEDDEIRIVDDFMDLC